jgi:hypothetical protein
MEEVCEGEAEEDDREERECKSGLGDQLFQVIVFLA